MTRATRRRRSRRPRRPRRCPKHHPRPPVRAAEPRAPRSSSASRHVRELSLIQALEATLSDRSGRLVRWIGDDAAVVRTRPLAVTSIDTIVEGVHFELATHTPADIGWKALATALSDLAAMGRRAASAASLALPAGFDGGLALVGGMEELAARYRSDDRRRGHRPRARVDRGRGHERLGRARARPGGP